jgi:hypothetical protein
VSGYQLYELRRKHMNRSKVVFLAVAAAALTSTSGAFAQICVNVSGSCNSYFFGTSPTNTPDVTALNGFEYGCGQSRTRHASGVLRRVSGRVEIEFTGTNQQFDFTQTVAWSGEVNVQNTGTYKVLYTYLSSGTLTAHGAAGPITLTDNPACAEPAAAAVAAATGQDTTQHQVPGR